jgi:hypothetical protein
MSLILSENRKPLMESAGEGGGCTCTQTTGDNAADATQPLQPAWRDYAADLNASVGGMGSP